MLWKSDRLLAALPDQGEDLEIAKVLAVAERATTVPEHAAQGHAVRPMVVGPFSASAAGNGVHKGQVDVEAAAVEKPKARVRTGRETVTREQTFRDLEDPVREAGKYRWGLGPSVAVAVVVSAQQEPLKGVAHID